MPTKPFSKIDHIEVTIWIDGFPYCVREKLEDTDLSNLKLGLWPGVIRPTIYRVLDLIKERWGLDPISSGRCSQKPVRDIPDIDIEKGGKVLDPDAEKIKEYIAGGKWEPDVTITTDWSLRRSKEP